MTTYSKYISKAAKTRLEMTSIAFFTLKGTISSIKSMRRCFLLVTAADMANQIIQTNAMVATSSTHAKECFSAYRQNTFAKSNTVRAMNNTADIYLSLIHI